MEADLEKNILLENNAILGIAKHEHKARVSLNKDKTKRKAEEWQSPICCQAWERLLTNQVE